MFDGQPYRDELVRRLDAVRRILDAAHPPSPVDDAADASRDARGIAVLLLYACYEHLLYSLCRRLLEIAVTLRVGNRRLRDGLLMFAAHEKMQSLAGVSPATVWKSKGRELLACVMDGRDCTINANLFPGDGSFMKRSQVMLFCEIFELGHPGPILAEVWNRLDAVVAERNAIAHGRLTPEEVGRNYSLEEMRSMVDVWQERWLSFIDHVEHSAQHRSFYRHERKR
ncbi:hypothetical protein [Thiohalocapsa sp. ML1]|uniref:hypothetical protein n=1 Tax=Thiohalocapsa sp. ML1 TaxID=1431688 RepID=UPI0012E355FB|nr:hypothetical protein [Thiohalocapsa sp. ML1]